MLREYVSGTGYNDPYNTTDVELLHILRFWHFPHKLEVGNCGKGTLMLWCTCTCIFFRPWLLTKLFYYQVISSNVHFLPWFFSIVNSTLSTFVNSSKFADTYIMTCLNALCVRGHFFPAKATCLKHIQTASAGGKYTLWDRDNTPLDSRCSQVEENTLDPWILVNHIIMITQSANQSIIIDF